MPINFKPDFFKLVTAIIPLLREYEALNGFEKRSYTFSDDVHQAVVMLLNHGISGDVGHLSVSNVVHAIIDEKYTCLTEKELEAVSLPLALQA